MAAETQNGSGISPQPAPAPREFDFSFIDFDPGELDDAYNVLPPSPAEPTSDRRPVITPVKIIKDTP